MTTERNLKIVQGNTKRYTITCEVRDFEKGDKITFSLKKYAGAKDYLLKKEITEFDGNIAVIEILPTDTSNIPTGKKYVYDIQFSSSDGRNIKTIYKGEFLIDWRVTDNDA